MQLILAIAAIIARNGKELSTALIGSLKLAFVVIILLFWKMAL
jgi:hypothetical protein